MEFKDILKNLRYESALTQKDIAKECKLSPQCISQLEMGIRNPTGSTLVALANYFDCSTDYLLGRKDDLGAPASPVQKYDLDSNQLTTKEQKIIDIIRRSAPPNYIEWITMYSALPTYLQENIFAELKGMYNGYTVSKSKNKKGENI